MLENVGWFWGWDHPLTWGDPQTLATCTVWIMIHKIGQWSSNMSWQIKCFSYVSVDFLHEEALLVAWNSHLVIFFSHLFLLPLAPVSSCFCSPICLVRGKVSTVSPLLSWPHSTRKSLLDCCHNWFPCCEVGWSKPKLKPCTHPRGLWITDCWKEFVTLANWQWHLSMSENMVSLKSLVHHFPKIATNVCVCSIWLQGFVIVMCMILILYGKSLVL